MKTLETFLIAKSRLCCSGNLKTPSGTMVARQGMEGWVTNPLAWEFQPSLDRPTMGSPIDSSAEEALTQTLLSLRV
jgi:hypothetical protein